MTSFGLISTYPPTRCGLATFTRALGTGLTALGEPAPRIVRLLDVEEAPSGRDAPGVVADLRQGEAASRRAAIRALAPCDVVIVQHEFGVYGGEDGEEVIDILEALPVPAIVVLHTVLPSPSPNQRRILENVAALASAIVVMTEHALETLTTTYAVDPRRVSVIPHGVTTASAHHPHEKGTVPRILTWGLLSPGKGLERGIRALGLLHMRGIRAEYVIAGQTHPKVIAHSGETYREGLAGLARALGVADSVRFVDRYLTEEDLTELLDAADAVLLPYDSHEQATSGVLVEAVAAGVPVVATAFPHAVELLRDGTGAAVLHDDLSAMADALEAILTAPSSADGMRAARQLGRIGLPWPLVAARYAALAGRLRQERAA